LYVLNLGVGRSADLADAAGKVIGRVTVVKGAGNRLKALAEVCKVDAGIMPSPTLLAITVELRVAKLIMDR
jgi:hypothetical protein